MFIFHHMQRFPALFVVISVTILLVTKAVTANLHDDMEDSTRQAPTTKMSRSLKGTKDFNPVHDDKQTGQKQMADLLHNNKKNLQVERNLTPTQQFQTKSELQTAVREYCVNPSGWVNNSKYAMYGPIENWDVSLITDMSSLFSYQLTCNPAIGGWDVSGVTTFYNMFRNAEAFNQDIGSWNVSKSVTFRWMFMNAYVFNQDISSWDVSNGENFRSMFDSAYAFNQDIGRWNVSKGTRFDEMFDYAYAFNQDIGSWDVSKSTIFYRMFFSAKAFNQDLSSWDVSKSTSFSAMFYNATSFSQNLCGWNKSPSAANINFCFNAFCGDCSPTSTPSSAPSAKPKCNVVDVLAQTLFLPGVPGAEACWRVQLADGGTLEGDFSDPSCSKAESKWRSSNGVFSIFDSISVSDKTVVFIPGTNGFSGTFQFVEDPTATQASLQLLSFNPATKEFAVEVTIPTCSPDAICPTMKVDLENEL